MHELAVCSELLDQVRATAASRGAVAAGRIKVILGELSGVEPDLLQQAFSIARAGEFTADAELLIEPAPIRIRCRECGNENTAAANHLLCTRCGGFRVDLLSGDELVLASIELHGVPEEPTQPNQSREASHV